MSKFNDSQVASFLGSVRKYMQVRGPMSQKELAEETGVGVSTMSRFLSQKTSELNPQMIAKIVAKLNIPLHEIIDFVEEDYADHFIRLVKFYKEESDLGVSGAPGDVEPVDASEKITSPPSAKPESFESELESTLGGGTAKRNVDAKVKVGGRTNTISFQADSEGTSIKDKLERLTPRQKAYMSDFLNLDMEARDLIVDLGNDLFRYFRQKGMTV